jgi:enoyl-CoA hydratase/carnithine racemase
MTPDLTLVSLHRERSVLRVCMADERRRNALSVQMTADLRSALSDLEGVAAITLFSTGPHFCAGGDHDEVATLTPEQMRTYQADLGAVFAALGVCPVPVVVAVQGRAIGGGTELAARADFVVAERSAVFALPQIPMGIGVTSGMVRVLAARCGLGFARRMLLRGERITAVEAHERGLVDILVGDGDSRGAAIAIAEELAARSGSAMSRARAALARVVAGSPTRPAVG